MNRYGPKAQRVIKHTLQEFKAGRLRSGRARNPVTNKRQALAIGIAKAHGQGYKVPKRTT